MAGGTESRPGLDEAVSRVADRVFAAVVLVATYAGIVALAVLLLYVTYDAVGWLDLDFLTTPPSRFAEDAGIYPALVGSVFMVLLVALLAFPVGVGAAIYMEEYVRSSRVAALVELNVANLAGVPSVVYGLLGLALFVRVLHMEHGTLFVGAATISLLVLPIVVVSAQEAIRSVSDSMRQASYGMGASRWQTVRRVVLPRSLPGILTGTILALARAIGETAPLLMIGAPSNVYTVPDGLFSRFSAMPRQLYAWTDLPQSAFQHGVLAAGVVTLLAVMLSLNAAAILVRHRYERRN